MDFLPDTSNQLKPKNIQLACQPNWYQCLQSEPACLMKCWSVKSRFIAIMFTHLAIKHIFRCKSTPGNHLAYRAPQLLIICIKCSFLASCSQMGDLDKNGFLSRMITIPMSLICQALYIQPPPPDTPQPIPDPSPTPPQPQRMQRLLLKAQYFLGLRS